MSFIKRVVSIILAVMMLSGFAVYADSVQLKESLSVEDTPAVQKAVTLLESLEIISKDEVQSKGLANPVTRSDAALYFARASAYDGSGKFYFKDITDGNYVKALASLVEQGAVSVPENREFYGDSFITSEQSAKIAVTLLGYSVLADMNGGYPTGYVKCATDLDLYEGMVSGGDFTLGNLVVLIANMLEANIMEIKLDNSLSYSSSDTSYLYSTRKICWGQGVVTGTRYIRYQGNIAPEMVEIDGNLYNCGLTNISDYFGHRIKFYYKDSDDVNEKKIVCIIDYKNEVTQMLAEDIEKASSSSYSYEKENGKTGKISLSDNCIFVYNGRGIIDPTEEQLIPESGIVTTISNDGDGQADVVIIFSYNNYVVSGSNINEQKIYLKGRDGDLSPSIEGNTIRLDDYTEVYLIRDSSEISLSEIKENQIISVAQGSDGSDKILYIWASYNTVTGTVEQSSKGDSIVVIQGEEYKVDKKYTDDRVYEMGTEKTFHLDAQDKIAYVSSATGSGKTVGFLAAVFLAEEYDENGDSVLKIFEIVDGDGVFCKYTVSDKVKIVSDEGNKKATYANLKMLCAEPINGQLIEYDKNEDGEITKIYVAKDCTNEALDTQDESHLRLSYEGNVTFGSRLANNYRIDGKVTKYIYVPSEYSKDEDDYLVTNWVPRQEYSAKLYNIGRDMLCRYVVIRGVNLNDSSSVSNNSITCVVDSIRDTADSEGEIKKTLYGYMNGAPVEYVLSDNIRRVPFCNRYDSYELPDGSIVTTSKRVDWYTDFGWAEDHSVPLKDTSELERGDMIQFTTNSKNEITYYRLMFDARRINFEENGVIKTWEDWDSTSGAIKYNYQYDSGIYIAYAKVIDVYNGYLVINANSAENYPHEWDRSLALNKPKYYVYDTKRDKVYVGSAEDVTRGSYVVAKIRSISSNVDVMVIK